MEGPGEMIDRAISRKKMGRLPGGARRQAAAEAMEGAQSVQEAQPAPKPISRHASYSALMRSHDRVHTRHIAPRS